MARGLNYLHACSPSILHGNLKASNILINTKGDACLCDFGLTQHHRPRMSLKPKKNQDGLGSVPWMSPEYYLSEMPTAQSDTWAFAMTGLELITGRAPFLPLDASQIADAIIVKRERPTRPQDATSVNYGLGDRLWALFTRCWSEDPSARPDIRAIVAVVDKLAGNWEARATSPVASVRRHVLFIRRFVRCY